MLSVMIICVGKLKERFYSDASAEYEKRLSGYCKLEVLEVPEHRLPEGSGQFVVRGARPAGDCMDAKNGDAQVGIALGKERAAIKRHIPSGALVVALCIEGREMDSNGLSEFLADCAVRGASRLCFVVGGSLGLHNDIKNGADLRLSMSKMTFPHNLARVVLLEQLYRAFNIAEGGKYHK